MIEFDVPEPSDVRLSVFNILGQEIAKLVSGILEAGHHSSEWNSENNNGISFPSGVYICRIQARSLTSQRENVQIRKMALMK
jgi:flagellar hook assembly protein FlgD